MKKTYCYKLNIILIGVFSSLLMCCNLIVVLYVEFWRRTKCIHFEFSKSIFRFQKIFQIQCNLPIGFSRLFSKSLVFQTDIMDRRSLVSRNNFFNNYYNDIGATTILIALKECVNNGRCPSIFALELLITMKLHHLLLNRLNAYWCGLFLKPP